MRATITIPDNLAEEVKSLSEGRPLSEFTRTALRERVDRLKTVRLARELDEGHRSEAGEPSLDPEWTAVETEGL